MRSCIVELQEFERSIDPRLRPGESMATEYFDHMLDRCERCAGTIVVAEVDGVLAGFVTILTRVPFESLDEPPGHHALVADLVVREAFRGRGLGTALLREAERYAAEAGAGEIHVVVLSENRGASRLYRRLGFHPHLETLVKRVEPPSM